jgi:diguanylate cyclase (GGDEF)-like protein
MSKGMMFAMDIPIIVTMFYFDKRKLWFAGVMTLSTLIEQHHAYRMPLQLALLDIDNFKSVNDTFGHQAGDAVLRKAADLIQEKISNDDVAFRYGGEEFAVLFTGKAFEDTFLILEQIRLALADGVYPELEYRKVTISAGESWNALIRRFYWAIGLLVFISNIAMIPYVAVYEPNQLMILFREPHVTCLFGAVKPLEQAPFIKRH